MKKFKKITKIITTALATALAFEAIPTYALSLDDNSIYIESESVPESATNYAKDIFANLNTDDIEFLGFSYNESCNMRLAPGFCAIVMDVTIDTPNVYYYPIICNDEIIALFTVTEINGKFSYQFGKNDLADSLNNVITSTDDSVAIAVSDEAFYGITDNEITVLSALPDADTNIIGDQIALLAEENNSNAIAFYDNIVTINEDTAYNDVSIQISSAKSVTYKGKKRAVPIVDNWTYEDSDGTSHGTCWASCTGSLIDYYNNGTSSSAESASKIRNTVKNARYKTTESYSGGISTAKAYIEEYVSKASMSKTGSSLLWSEVKTEILTNNAPCYTRWENSSSSTGHAMVLCGYRYQSEKSNNSDYYGIYLMDPNEKSFQLASYGDTYTLNGKTFSWVNTLTKD